MGFLVICCVVIILYVLYMAYLDVSMNMPYDYKYYKEFAPSAIQRMLILRGKFRIYKRKDNSVQIQFKAPFQPYWTPVTSVYRGYTSKIPLTRESIDITINKTIEKHKEFLEYIRTFDKTDSYTNI